jgi:hypothetical protein
MALVPILGPTEMLAGNSIYSFSLLRLFENSAIHRTVVIFHIRHVCCYIVCPPWILRNVIYTENMSIILKHKVKCKKLSHKWNVAPRTFPSWKLKNCDKCAAAGMSLSSPTDVNLPLGTKNICHLCCRIWINFMCHYNHLISLAECHIPHYHLNYVSCFFYAWVTSHNL